MGGCNWLHNIWRKGLCSQVYVRSFCVQKYNGLFIFKLNKGEENKKQSYRYSLSILLFYIVPPLTERIALTFVHAEWCALWFNVQEGQLRKKHLLIIETGNIFSKTINWDRALGYHTLYPLCIKAGNKKTSFEKVKRVLQFQTAHSTSRHLHETAFPACRDATKRNETGFTTSKSRLSSNWDLRGNRRLGRQ